MRFWYLITFDRNDAANEKGSTMEIYFVIIGIIAAYGYGYKQGQKYYGKKKPKHKPEKISIYQI